MAKTMIIGDGPGGLSAALFLAKNGVDATVVGRDDTPMHKAMLYNYLGIPEITGSDFMEVAREHVQQHGVELRDGEVVAIEKTDDGFVVETDSGDEIAGDYLVLALGNRDLARQAGVDLDHEVDRHCATNVPGVYLIGWLVRPRRCQAIISAGDGAAAALDILSREKGEEFHDFDVVED